MRPFGFVELGAGYGHWTFAAHAALQQKCAHAPHRYLLVDVLQASAGSIAELARLNNVTDTPEHALHFHAGFVADTTRPLTSGERGSAQKNREDFGKNLLGTSDQKNNGRGGATGESSIGMAELFERYNAPMCIDMVDIDIQGGEYVEFFGRKGIFAGDGNLRILSKRAKRVHIGLHGSTEQDTALVSRFRAHGWRVRWQFAQRMWVWSSNGRHRFFNRPDDTPPWGPVLFSDGVLSFVNNNTPSACRV